MLVKQYILSSKIENPKYHLVKILLLNYQKNGRPKWTPDLYAKN